MGGYSEDAISPQLVMQAAEDAGYVLIHEGGVPDDSCGQVSSKGEALNLDECAATARNMGLLAFSFGREEAAHACHVEAITFTIEEWKEATTNRRNPGCKDGHWLDNPLFDTYMLKPLTG